MEDGDRCRPQWIIAFCAPRPPLTEVRRVRTKGRVGAQRKVERQKGSRAGDAVVGDGRVAGLRPVRPEADDTMTRHGLARPIILASLVLAGALAAQQMAVRWSWMREEARQVSMGGNYRQLSLAYLIYVPDLDDWEPTARRVLKDRTLREAQWMGGDLRNLGFAGCDLRSADLRGARLCGTRFQRCDLRGARLDGADLSGARFDRFTQWPRGFDPVSHGASLDQ